MGSPQLLMLSGIGPSDHLAALNIPTIHDNPSVGDHMADNPTNSLVVFTNKQVEISLIQVVGITNFGSYIEVYSGLAQVNKFYSIPSNIKTYFNWALNNMFLLLL